MPNPSRISDETIELIMSSELNGTALARIIGVCQGTVSKYRRNGGYKKEHRGNVNCESRGKSRSVPISHNPDANSFFSMKLV